MNVILQGWGTPFQPLTLGYGVAVPVLSPGVTLRETFSVPLPDGPDAVRHAQAGQRPYLGSSETGIAFALDFRGWLAASEAVVSLAQLSCWAFPEQGGSAPYDATTLVVQSSLALGTQAIVTLHQATAQTDYVVTIAAQTTAGRILECRMPRIWCPD